MEDSTNPAVPPASRCWMGGFFLLVEDDDDDDDASSLPLLDDDDDDDEVEVEVAIKLLPMLIPLLIPPTFCSASVRPVRTLLASMLVPLLVIRLEDDGIMVYYLCAVY